MSVKENRRSMNGLSSVTCMILAGGMGTRLRRVVSDRPKVLADVSGRPFITYILDKLDSDGARDVILCTGYMADKVEAALGLSYKGMTLRYSVETEPLGTGGALSHALSLIHTETVLVLNGDSLTDASYSGFAQWFDEKKGDAGMMLVWSEDTRRFGSVIRDGDGGIVSFNEKGLSHGGGWINAGVYMMTRRLIAGLPDGVECSLEKDCFPRIAGTGLYGYTCRASFIDMGTEMSYSTAADFVRRFEL
jgi:NDP-sugar pyrophosphorylase family protein